MGNCEWVEFQLSDGTVARAHVKYSRPRPRNYPCVGCGRVGQLLCDAPLADKGTCDASICRGCCIEDGPDLHFCPDHVPASGFVAKDLADWAEFVRERFAIGVVLGCLEPVAAMDQARRLAGPRPRSTPNAKRSPARVVSPPPASTHDQLELAGTSAWRTA